MMNRKLALPKFLLFSFIFLFSYVNAAENLTESSVGKVNLGVEKYVLPNGLTVLLLQDSKIPLISLHTWYKVGSRNESQGVTGAAHMLEHMMFKGSKKYSGKDFDRILNSLGAVNNAFTTNDYTGFYESFPSEHLETILDIESDRMANLNLAAEDLKSEREVVKEERRWRVDNNPSGALGEVLNLTIFKKSQYSWPVIGHMADIENYNVDKLRFFHNNFYGPNNAVLVVVGDFDKQQTKDWIQKYYSQIPSRTVPSEKFEAEPEQKSARSVVLFKNVQAPRLLLAYPTVGSDNIDSRALDLLGAILGGGTSSRLHRRLVYKTQKASSVGAENGSMAKAGVFEISATLLPNSDAQDVAKDIRNELANLKRNKVTDRELDRAKTLIMKDAVKRLMTADNKARVLAEYEIVYGDYRKIDSELDEYMKVSADDIMKVANQYLKPNHETFAELKTKAKGGN